MEEDYTFEKMWEDLNNGYQIYYTYVGNRYLLFKTTTNCYTQIYPFMEDIEYKVNLT